MMKSSIKYQSPYKGFNRKKMNINAYATLVEKVSIPL